MLAIIVINAQGIFLLHLLFVCHL